MPAPSTDHPPGAPTRLTVNDDPAPLAVTGPPAFGWMVNDVDRGEIQKAYQLVVSDAPTAEKHTVVFDSGPVTSNQEAYVAAPALRLLPDHRYWWTVRTQDAAGRFGPYAADANFDTALGDADWDAAWIRRSGTVPKVVQVDGTDVPMDDFALIRKELTVSSSPRRAGARVRGGRSAVRVARQRNPGRRRTVVFVSQRAVLRDDRCDVARAGRRRQRVRVRHSLGNGESRPPRFARGVHRAHQHRPRGRHASGAHHRRLVANAHRDVDSRRAPQRRG